MLWLPLLSVLVYIGIRIVLSSSGADKAKFKQMLKDWLIALCLVFFMQYFMSFVISFTGVISKSLLISGLLSIILIL